MSTFEDVLAKIDELAANIREQAPQIVAETATSYYKERFTEKSWDGEPWTPAKHPPGRGSLMVRSGALMRSIRPTLVSATEVRIGAGNDRVPYARIHNEGGVIRQVPTAKQRRFFWAMERSEKKGAEDTGAWAKMARSETLNIPIPRRQFMGHSPVLNDRLVSIFGELIMEPFK